MKNRYLFAITAFLLPFHVGAADWRGTAHYKVISTVGANTWACPAPRVHYILTGGGGGGGGGLNDASFGGGGGGGAAQIVEGDYYCVPGETLTVTIGDGGTAGSGGTTGNVTAGGNGGDTTLAGSSIELGTINAQNGLGGALAAAAGGAGGSNGGGLCLNSAPAGAAAATTLTTDCSGLNRQIRSITTGSGGGATASNPGNGINIRKDGAYRTSSNGAGGSGGCGFYWCDGVNVGGTSGANAPTPTATCYGCGGGGGGGSNGAASNGAVGIKGVAIFTW